MRSAAWLTFREAMTEGWGATERLCLLMLVRYGLPGYGVMHLCGPLLARIH